MTRSVRVRIPALGRDVTISRLTESDIKKRLLDKKYMERFTSLVEDGTTEEEEAAIAVALEMYTFGTATVLATIDACIKDFDKKIAPEIEAMDDAGAREAITSLYKECILANPVLDYTAAKIYMTGEPLADELHRLISFLPEEVSTHVVDHIFRYSVTDNIVLDEVISSQQILSVPDEAITFEDDVELSLDMAKVKNLKEELYKRMVGQRHAIDHVATVARRIAVGFRDPSRPPAVAMLVGPTGVGKTMLAKETAGLLFGDKAFGRIDCAQISERHGSSKLLGAPPGYVGYPTSRDPKAKPEDLKKMDPALMYRETLGMEQGGVLLIDEIEKADVDVLDVLLTAFDEGYVKTSVGNVVDLRNVIILVTSNLGARELSHKQKKNTLGFTTGQAACESPSVGAGDVKKTTMEAIRRWMKPELLSRVTAIIPFTDLDHDEIKEVIDLEWKKASKYVEEKITAEIIITDQMKDALADRAKDRGSGARYVSRLVDTYIVDTIAALFVECDDVFDVDFIELTLDPSGTCDTVVAQFGDTVYRHDITMSVGD